MMSRSISARGRQIRHARPACETLEGRLLLYSTLGGEWAFPARVTYSFAPDQTSIGGIPSALNSAMAARGISTGIWKDQFRKAAAIWQQVANINLVEVSDSGAPYAVSGNQQNDSRFGDIRIGGTPLAGGGLALTFAPPPLNGGTAAGDIVFNTNVPWSIDSGYDVLTVAIHEIGHALGMGHAAISSAEMYASYNAIKPSLTGDDVAGIQSIYGPRLPDCFDAAASNNTYSTATNLTPYLSAGKASLSGLDVTSAGDYDWYVVTAPATTNGTLAVTMQSSNLSSLSPRVQIYNSSLQGLAQATTSVAYGGTVTASIAGVTAGQVFYIRAMAAVSGPTSAGAYGLQVNFAGGTMSSISPPNTTVAQQADRGGGSLALTEAEHGGHRPRRPLARPRGPLAVGHGPESVALGSLRGVGEVLETSFRRVLGRMRPRGR